MLTLVTLKYKAEEHSTRLVNQKLHIPTVKDTFGLSSVDVAGVAEATDNQGFTFATYEPGVTLQISGRPAAGLFTCYVVLLTLCCCSYTQQRQVTQLWSQLLFQANSMASSLAYLTSLFMHASVALRILRLLASLQLLRTFIKRNSCCCW